MALFQSMNENVNVNSTHPPHIIHTRAHPLDEKAQKTSIHTQKTRPITNYMAFHIMSCVLFIAVGIFGIYFCADDKQTKNRRHYSTFKISSKFIQ